MLQSGDLLGELNIKWQQQYPGLARLQFSDWVSWSERKTVRNVNEVGVYMLAKHHTSEVPPVDPLDEHLIYFGQTGTGKTISIKNRLNTFHRVAFLDGGGHAGGSNYRNIFGTDQNGLHVSICPVYWTNGAKERFPGEAEFVISRVVCWLEVCLRGIYVYKWGRLPKCNKE
ncbi:hypothetical protein M1N13_03530 [Dehalococcoidia bacterium]|nr:hypothetical protein [Dehalococcoidia bacterium]MCL0103886.1 hypothetical protein [Dehalococcoidia bacterium]